MQNGNLSVPAGIKNAAADIEKAGKMFGGISNAARSFNSVLDSVASTLVGAVSSAATGVGTVLAGGFALAVKEAFHFNSEMEKTQIGLANMANAAGMTSSLSGAFRLSGDVIKQMRVDARELPGEFKDLQQIMALIEPATANAGIGLFGTEKMASKTMVAASMLNVPTAVAGREMSMMLAGSARHSMPLFTKLGFTDAKAFNHLSQEGRTAAINEKLDKLNSPQALAIVKGTWETIRSTAIDTFRQSAAMVGGPLFARVKDLVQKFNELGKNDAMRERLVDFGVKLGQGIVNAFDRGVAAVEYWYGPVTTFLGTMERGFARVFGGLGTFLTPLVSRLESILNDPAAFSKMQHLIGQLIALRVGGAVVQGGGSLLSAGVTAAPGLAAMGLPMAEFAAAVPYAAVALGVAAAGAYGFTSALTDSTSSLHDAAMLSAATNVAAVSRLGRELERLAVGVTPLLELLGVGLARVAEHVVGTLADLAQIANECGSALQSLANFWSGPMLRKTDPNDNDAWKTRQQADLLGFSKLFNAPPEPSDLGAKKPPVHNTTIHKVEIKVNSNQDPSRIARATVDLLKDLARNPTSAALNPASRFAR